MSIFVGKSFYSECNFVLLDKIKFVFKSVSQKYMIHSKENRSLLSNVKTDQITSKYSTERPSVVRRSKSVGESNLNTTTKLIKELKIKPHKLVNYLGDNTIPNDNLEERINLIKETGIKDEATCLELLKAPLQDLEYFSYTIKFYRPKLLGFAELAGCSVIDASRHFKKYKFLMQSKISTLRKKIHVICEEGGVSKDELNRDLWSLLYNLEKLEDRCKTLKEMNINPMKPWMFRCSERIIYRTWRCREENRLAMAPHKSPVGFLCEKLSMSDDEVSAFAAKHPPAMRVQVTKLKEMIDYLFSEGFTAAQVRQTPRILSHSRKKIQARLNTLHEVKYEPQLPVLCLSSKNFNMFLRKISPSA